ncbi:hypothetical protein F2S72_01870 [Pseudomonas syringae pv. actinidiae]|nr:hypothetical protein [Pseudomonas syringae pv. actinidiae]
MKETVQIKANLLEGQHDALIEFYGRFNRLFVNKLLLKLCEGVIPDYEPSLALFQSSVPEGAKVARKVAIRIEKDKHPLMWEFYKDLPYGSRTMVIVNLMNQYATLAEADPSIMENTYWSRRPETAQKGSAERAGQSVQQGQGDQKSALVAVSDDRAVAGSRGVEPSSAKVGPEAPNDEGAEVEADPLTMFSTGL